MNATGWTGMYFTFALAHISFSSITRTYPHRISMHEDTETLRLFAFGIISDVQYADRGK